jgi:hypothetical protein
MKVYVVITEYGAGGWVSIRKIFTDKDKAIEYSKLNQCDDVEEYEVIE